MQVHSVQREVVLSLHCQRHFFDRAHFCVRTRASDTHGRRIIHPRFDEVILAQAHALALLVRGKVIDAVLLDRHFRGERRAG